MLDEEPCEELEGTDPKISTLPLLAGFATGTLGLAAGIVGLAVGIVGLAVGITGLAVGVVFAVGAVGLGLSPGTTIFPLHCGH